ncbi:MAG: hypothetical protein ACLT1T_03240 [Oscillospiraceae bacterium]
MEKAQHDMREFDRLTAKKYRSPALCWIFAIAGLALAAVGWFRLHEILICAAGALIALGCVGLALLHARHNRRREQELDQAQALLALYGNRSRDEFAVLAADTREALRVWRAACSRAAEDAASYEAAKRLRPTHRRAARQRPDVLGRRHARGGAGRDRQGAGRLRRVSRRAAGCAAGGRAV